MNEGAVCVYRRQRHALKPEGTQSNLFYGRKMIEFAALTFSFVTIFVLSSVTRNKRERRMNPKQLELAGYFLCGLLFASAAVLQIGRASCRERVCQYV